MDCRTARKRIETRHDDVPSLEQEGELQAHLGACTRCAQVAFDMDQVFAWLRELPEAQPAESFDWRLRLRLARIERERDARVLLGDALPIERRAPLQFAVSAAAAAVIVVALGLLVVHPRTGRQVAGRSAPGAGPSDVVLRAEPGLGSQPSLVWPRPVPVRAGAPLGPEQVPAPSILGPVDSDSVQSRWQLEPPRPVRVTSPTFVGNPGSARRVP